MLITNKLVYCKTVGNPLVAAQKKANNSSLHKQTKVISVRYLKINAESAVCLLSTLY